MLVLSRKKGQCINIGSDIKIVVLDIQPDRISIGIEAPPQVDIYRTELYQAVQQANQQAVTGEKVLALLTSEQLKNNKKCD